MVQDGKQNSAGGEIDPAKLEQLLEIELMQKRAGWEKARARRGSLRAMSFLFLFLVIVAGLVAYFVFLSPDKVRDMESTARNPAQTSPTP